MKRINLRDYYPSYTSDFFLEVAVADWIKVRCERLMPVQ